MIRYLKYFTQDEVDKAPGEILTKDLPYGGKSPYVIGTILTDENGDRIQHVSAFRENPYNLCIEHAPDEFVDYKVVKGQLTDVELPLTQIGECGFGRVVRVGLIPLYDTGSAHDEFTIQSRTPQAGEVDNPRFYFCKEKALCTVENTNTYAGRIPYCEAPQILFEPEYSTHSVRFASITTSEAFGCVIYCVYKLHDGRFVTNGYNNDVASRSYSRLVVPVRTASWEYTVCPRILSYTSRSIRVDLYNTFSASPFELGYSSGTAGYDTAGLTICPPSFYCIPTTAHALFGYGALLSAYTEPSMHSAEFVTKLSFTQ